MIILLKDIVPIGKNVFYMFFLWYISYLLLKISKKIGYGSTIISVILVDIKLLIIF